MLRPLDHPIEIVCPHGILVLVGGQAEAFAKLRRNKGSTYATPGKHAFVGAEDNQVAEIQRTGFQRAHHLQALQGFSAERHRNALQQTGQKPQMGGRKHLQVHFLKDVQLLVAARHKVQLQKVSGTGQLKADIGQQLGKIGFYPVVLGHIRGGHLLHHRPEQPLQQGASLQVLFRYIVFGSSPYLLHRILLPFRKQGLQKAGRKDFPQFPVVEVPLAAGIAQLKLHATQGIHQGIHRAGGHGIAHGHVHVVAFIRNGIQKRKKQAFVREDEGCFYVRFFATLRMTGSRMTGSRMTRSHLFQEPGGQLALAYGGGNADDRHGRTGTGLHREGLGIIQDIAFHEKRRLVGLVLDFLGHIVPHEFCQPGIPHAG